MHPFECQSLVAQHREDFRELVGIGQGAAYGELLDHDLDHIQLYRLFMGGQYQDARHVLGHGDRLLEHGTLAGAVDVQGAVHHWLRRKLAGDCAKGRLQRSGQVFSRRIDASLGAQLASALQSLVDDVDDRDSFDATVPEGCNNTQADGAGTEQDYLVARTGLAKIQAVHTDRDRFGQNCSIKRQGIRNREDRFTRNCLAHQKKLGEPTVLRVAGADAIASFHRMDHYALADRNALHSLADLMYGARQLMSEGHGLRTRSADIAISGEADVAAANTEYSDLNYHVPWSGLRHRHFVDTQVLWAVQTHLLHLHLRLWSTHCDR
ncbi:hypothetical protein PCA10_27710 [Metapseudomonas resinovorans NBRC 106553]|uniref:Uncharacterized protein n=1 Tax=Metapseudomonas resinovorans NBRC 106553 TaxID=1245471 RepID=S6ARH7_METRE|nr:hypothetical protein PCA10_27710 [Pseudomonas resinovorans NBRC 106553]